MRDISITFVWQKWVPAWTNSRSSDSGEPGASASTRDRRSLPESGVRPLELLHRQRGTPARVKQ